MIKGLFRAVLVNATALYLATQFIGGFHLAHGLESFAIVVLIFTAVHLFIKPILKAILGVINFATFGLISLVIDVAILYFLSIFLPQIVFTGWFFPGFYYSGVTIPAYNFNAIGSTIVTAVLISLIRSFLHYLTT